MMRGLLAESRLRQIQLGLEQSISASGSALTSIIF